MWAVAVHDWALTDVLIHVTKNPVRCGLLASQLCRAMSDDAGQDEDELLQRAEEFETKARAILDAVPTSVGGARRLPVCGEQGVGHVAAGDGVDGGAQALPVPPALRQARRAALPPLGPPPPREGRRETVGLLVGARVAVDAAALCRHQARRMGGEEGDEGRPSEGVAAERAAAALVHQAVRRVLPHPRRQARAAQHPLLRVHRPLLARRLLARRARDARRRFRRRPPLPDRDAIRAVDDRPRRR